MGPEKAPGPHRSRKGNGTQNSGKLIEPKCERQIRALRKLDHRTPPDPPTSNGDKRVFKKRNSAKQKTAQNSAGEKSGLTYKREYNLSSSVDKTKGRGERVGEGGDGEKTKSKGRKRFIDKGLRGTGCLTRRPLRLPGLQRRRNTISFGGEISEHDACWGVGNAAAAPAAKGRIMRARGTPIGGGKRRKY